MDRIPRTACLVFLGLLALPAIGAAATPTHRPGLRDPAAARCIAHVTRLAPPGTALFDAGRGVFLVSEIVGGPTTRDHNGRIIAVGLDGRRDPDPVVAGGLAGATLHAPKGMLLAGDTLWVADIDAVRAFD